MTLLARRLNEQDVIPNGFSYKKWEYRGIGHFVVYFQVFSRWRIAIGEGMARIERRSGPLFG